MGATLLEISSALVDLGQSVAFGGFLSRRKYFLHQIAPRILVATDLLVDAFLDSASLDVDLLGHFAKKTVSGTGARRLSNHPVATRNDSAQGQIAQVQYDVAWIRHSRRYKFDKRHTRLCSGIPRNPRT